MAAESCKVQKADIAPKRLSLPREQKEHIMRLHSRNWVEMNLLGGSW